MLLLFVFSTSAFCEPPLGMHVTNDFQPGKSEEFQSPLPWQVSVKCHIKTEDQECPMEGKLLSGEASINGKKYHTHDHLILPMHSGDSIKIKAGSFIKVRLTNQGEHTLHVDCDL